MVNAPLSAVRPGLAAGRLRYVSAARGRDDSYQIVLLTEEGIVDRVIPLAGRGHDIAISPDARTIVAFARRPGMFAVAIDVTRRSAPHVFNSPAGRHFYGHGVFSSDGRLLYATENAFDEAAGVLGVYDVDAAFRRIGELPTHGVGPHEVLLLGDGQTLCVANGGIETHPDAGRAKLNIDTMAPSIAFIDARTGDLKAQHALARGLHQLSLRHMCLDEQGQVWFGGQWEGGPDATPWLVGRVGIDKPIALIEPAALTGKSLNGYIGSMATSADGRIIVASAPRAGRVVYFDAATAKLVGEAPMTDVCGLAPAGGADMARTSGEGLFEIAAPGSTARLTARVDGLSFDNHLRRIT